MDAQSRARQDGGGTARRCSCPECRAGDALPARLQGWPNAYQIPLFNLHTARRIAPVMQPRSLDDWNYPRLRDACTDRCAAVGDPPCHELNDRALRGVNADDHTHLPPCGECWRDVGVEPGDEFDEEAAVGKLL